MYTQKTPLGINMVNEVIRNCYANSSNLTSLLKIINVTNHPHPEFSPVVPLVRSGDFGSKRHFWAYLLQPLFFPSWKKVRPGERMEFSFTTQKGQNNNQNYALRLLLYCFSPALHHFYKFLGTIRPLFTHSTSYVSTPKMQTIWRLLSENDKNYQVDKRLLVA